MPAICFHTTMKTGLLTPSKKHLLYYLLPIYLAGSSWQQRHSRVDSIKYAVLVHYIFLIVLTNWGIRTLVNASDKRFLLITLFSIYSCSTAELRAHIWVYGARGGIRTHAKLCWQQTDSYYSSHIFWTQECYPPAWVFLCFRTHSTYPP